MHINVVVRVDCTIVQSANKMPNGSVRVSDTHLLSLVATRLGNDRTKELTQRAPTSEDDFSDKKSKMIGEKIHFNAWADSCSRSVRHALKRTYQILQHALC
jgi:hypothetical protein